MLPEISNEQRLTLLARQSAINASYLNNKPTWRRNVMAMIWTAEVWMMRLARASYYLLAKGARIG